MPRHDAPAALDPSAQRELDALDAILAGRDPGPEHAPLAELVGELRSLTEPIDAGFAAQLDERVSAGFARRRRWLPAVRPRRLVLGGLAVAACAAVGAVVLGSSGGGPGGSPAKSTTSAVMSDRGAASSGSAASGVAVAPSAPSTPPAPEPPLPGPVPPAPVPPAPVPPGEVHKVQRATSLTLATSADSINRVSDGVARVTERFGGYVQSSDGGTADGGQGQANFDLRVPTARLDAAMGELARLAHVRSRSQSSTDITSSFDSARAALAEARAERQALLRALGAASTPNEIASIRERLRLVAGRLAQDRQNLKRLSDSANLSEVSVSVVADTHAPGGAGAWTLGDALHDAGRVLAVALGVALIGLAALVPLSLAGALAALGLAAWRRRRRAAALELA